MMMLKLTFTFDLGYLLLCKTAVLFDISRFVL